MLRVGSTCVSMHNLAVAGWDGIKEGGGMGSAKLSSRQSLNRISSSKLSLVLILLEAVLCIYFIFKTTLTLSYLFSLLCYLLSKPNKL